jgi:aspartyl-tRNA(Asn)/glutamyl-tRNA(Gln) amidotransferase subunit A
MIAFASSLDQCGPLTRDVTDAALLYRHMIGRDKCDSTSLQHPEEIRLPSAESLDGLRFGVPRELAGHEGIESGVAEVFDTTIALIEKLGGMVEEIALPHSGYGLQAYYVLAPAEASANLARYDGVRYGLRATDGDLDSMYEETRAQGFGAEVKRRIMLGTYALSSGYYDAYYGTAQRVRTKIADDFRAAFESVDLIVTPTSPTVPFKLGERAANPLAMYASDVLTVPMSLAGIPAISIPGGLSEGLPVGVQITGPAFSENRIFEASHALEKAIGFEGVPTR